MSTNSQRGFSMIEVIVFIVIVSVALTGVLSVMNVTTQRSADPLVRKQAIAVAESMLEEITLQNFDNPSGGYTCPSAPCIQADRIRVDDVSDYHGFSSTGVYPIEGSTAITGLGAYTVAVSVVGAALGTIAATDSKLISVTVTGTDNVSVTVSAYRANYGS